MKILNKMKDFDSGFLHIKKFFSTEEINSLQNLHNQNFPSYEDGLKSFGRPNRNNPYYKEVYFDKLRKTRFDGVPLIHRIFRAEGSPNLNDTPNILYGKRASKKYSNLPVDYDKIIFTEKLFDIIRSCLNSKDPKLFLNHLSANRVYPKYQGESEIYHIDTYGFTGNNMEFTEDYMINMIIYY